MLKKLQKFGKDDWKHIFWLLKQFVKSVFRADWQDARLCWTCLRLHLCYDCRKGIFDDDGKFILLSDGICPD